MPPLHQKFVKFLSLVRWDDWKTAKLSLVFLYVLYFQYLTAFLGEGLTLYFNFFLLFIASICYYAFLFFVNDFYDIGQDVKSGKKKHTEYLNKSKAILLIISLLAVGTASWLISGRSITPVSVGLFSIGSGLAFFYSAPPIRFKERGFWGIIVGSLVLRPVCLAILLAGFNLGHYLIDAIIIFVWLEMLSIRRIIKHQMVDYYLDLRGMVKTFVTQSGLSAAQNVNRLVFSPLEAFFLVVALGLMLARIKQLVFVVSVYIIIHLLLFLKKPKVFKSYFIAEKPLFYDLYFLFVPLTLSFLVARKEGVWAIPVFVLLWEAGLLKNFFSLLLNFVPKNSR